MSLFRRLFAWFFRPSLPRLERHASELGVLTLQQYRNPTGMSWMCSIRPTKEDGYKGYAWTGTADTIEEAMKEAVTQATDYPLGAKPVLPHAPKLGGAEFDEE